MTFDANAIIADIDDVLNADCGSGISSTTRKGALFRACLERWAPPGSSYLADCRVALTPGAKPFEHGDIVDRMRSSLMSLRRDVEKGLLRKFEDGVRAETVGEVLDQAEQLLSKNHLVAATVLAGGALETHLRRLCDRSSIMWSGNGGIGAYNDAIGKARNDGTANVYSASEQKQITAWGGLRNDAAHDPTTFAAPKDAIRRMVDGIRDFLVRVP